MGVCVKLFKRTASNKVLGEVLALIFSIFFIVLLKRKEKERSYLHLLFLYAKLLTFILILVTELEVVLA